MKKSNKIRDKQDKKISDVLKEAISDENNKKLKKILNEINKIHSIFFSKPKKFFFLIVYIFMKVITIFLPFLISILVIVLTLSLPNLLNNIETNIIHKTASALFAITSFMFGSIIIGLIISLFTNDEYFDKNEAKMFMEIKTFGLNNLFITIASIIQWVLTMIAFETEADISTITCSLSTIIYSILIIYSYCRFKFSNKIERYFYYLKGKNELYTFSRYNAFLDCERALKTDPTKMNAEEMTFELIKTTLNELLSFFKLLDKISEKLNNGEDVIKEQNIIEEYIKKLFKKAKSPYQHLIIVIMINSYYKMFLKKINKGGSTKQIYYTTNKLMDCYLKSNNKIANIIIQFQIEINVIKYMVLSPNDLMDSINKVDNILNIQRYYLVCCTAICKEFEDLSLLVNKKQSCLLLPNIEKIQTNLDAFKERYESNNNCYLNLLTLSNKFYGELLSITEKVNSISAGKKESKN